ncbi:MAG: radical SAM family heme chaperone HemW [Clostridia bacterium]|nr:radical SAM family heme chaperone HemW [Clostridia bacterium]
MRSFFDDFSLYIHIPYCASKCAYCDFLSFADRTTMRDYFGALVKEIERESKKHKRKVTSVYIGGGTPSLTTAFFPALKDAIFGNFSVESDAEISVEANPESVTEEFVRAAKDLGVNRVSLGVQSLSDRLLKRIGRVHDEKTALAALTLLTENFPSVGADVMVGLPSETDSDVSETIEKLSDFPLSHLSCYGLILEKGTRLYEEAKHGDFIPDEDLSADRYDLACDLLGKRGFSRYEISNFCRDGKVCRYNTSVWQYADYLGLGLGASSFIKRDGGFPASRRRNARDLIKYIESEGAARPAFQRIDSEEGKEEFIMLGLRLSEGLDLARYRLLFGSDLLEERAENLEKLAPFLLFSEDKLAIRPEFFYVSNSIISDLI